MLEYSSLSCKFIRYKGELLLLPYKGKKKKMQVNDEGRIEQYCSKYFKYKNFLECSDTYKATLCDNIPKEENTYKAISMLASEILDKVYEKFDAVNLTYGFCSSDLNKKISKNNSPELDQHAGHELNSKGNPICKRLGFASDFTVPEVSSLFVARFIVENLKFDRLYYYGYDRPIHVSLNDNPIFLVVLMPTRQGRRIPKNVTKENFLKNDINF